MKSKHFLLVLFTVFISCDPKNNSRDNIRFSKGTKVIKIDKPMNDTLIYLSSFVKNVDIIPLETNERSIIGDIVKLKIFEDKIYIKDKYNSDLLVFDISGRFLNTIGRAGKGPDEYMSLTDFEISESSGRVFIYDNFTMKIFEFLSDGRFIKSIKMPFAADNFAINQDLIYLYRNNPTLHSEFSLNIYDTLGSVKGQYFKSIPRELGMRNQTALGGSAHNNDFLSFQESLYTYIYTIKKGDVHPTFWVDFGKNNLTAEAREKIFENPLKHDSIALINNFVTQVKNVHFLKEFLIFNYVYNHLNHTVFYKIRNNKVYNSYNIIDDISHLYFELPIFQYQDRLVRLYSPHQVPSNIRWLENLINGKKQEGYPVPKTAIEQLELLKQAEPYAGSMNPYILLYSFK